jgi:predicted  nucleic acid-binding Zn-ribbon protein
MIRIHIVQEKFKIQVQILQEQDAAKAEKIKDLECHVEEGLKSITQLEGRMEAHAQRIQQLESDFNNEQAQRQVLGCPE